MDVDDPARVGDQTLLAGLKAADETGRDEREASRREHQVATEADDESDLDEDHGDGDTDDGAAGVGETCQRRWREPFGPRSNAPQQGKEPRPHGDVAGGLAARER